MDKEYKFFHQDVEKKEKATAVVNVCEVNGVESGIPADERDMDSLESKETAVMYTEALKNNTALPIFVGMPHAGEFVPKDKMERVADTKAFVEGLDAGTATLFSPRTGDNYVAVRNRVSRLIADPNRGPQQFRQGLGVGGVTWTNNFKGERIYKEGQEPTDEEMAENVDRYYTPYYRSLHALVASLHEKMNYDDILFLDAHSFPGTTDVPQIGLVASEPKPLFIVGSQGSSKASKEVMTTLVDALRDHAPSREEFPEMYKHISETIHEATEFGWGGARNVAYFGHPEGTGASTLENELQADQEAGCKVHAVQLEMNMSAFFEGGKYNRKHVEALRQTIQKVIQLMGESLKKEQKV